MCCFYFVSNGPRVDMVIKKGSQAFDPNVDTKHLQTAVDLRELIMILVEKFLGHLVQK